MFDREKVIKGLECAIGIRGRKNCDDCPYDNDFNCIGCDIVIRDAIALLKEQETTFEKDGHHIMCKSCGAYFCDKDREGDQYPRNFCPNCGKAVK